MTDEDKFAEYRRQSGEDTRATWPGWVIAGVLLVATTFSWSIAGPAYFSSKPTDSPVTQSTRGKWVNKSVDLNFPWKRKGELAVLFLDIWQGDATLIHTPNGKTVLIDSGEGKNPDNPYGRKVDAANRVILPLLMNLGIKKIDIIITSHPHSDHIGAMSDIVRSSDIDIGELWISGFVTATKANKRLLKAVEERGVRLRTPDKKKLPKNLNVDPAVSMWIIQSDAEAKHNNNSSIVVKLVYGGVSFLFTGDAEKHSEDEMVMTWGKTLKSTILKVGHHGSVTSSSSTFMSLVKPEVASISCGAGNTYSHPRPETIKKFKDMGIRIYRTDKDGFVGVYTDGKTYRVHASQGDKGFEQEQKM